MAKQVSTIPFRKVIAAGVSSYIDYEVPDYATLEKLNIYFASGNLFSLQLNPVILQSGSKLPTPIPSYPSNGDNYVTGDGSNVEFDVSRPLTPYDIIRIYYNNTDGANTATLAVDAVIDYYAGRARVV